MMLRGYLSSQGEGGKICSGRPKVATCPLGPNDRHIVKWQELNLQQKQQQQHWEDDERREGGVMRILAFAIVVFAALATMELPTTAKKRVALVPIDAELSSRSPGSLSRQEEGALKAKDEFKECEKCPMMVVVPAGSFTMGSPQSEPGRYYDEGPQHHVTFAKPFAVGKLL